MQTIRWRRAFVKSKTNEHLNDETSVCRRMKRWNGSTSCGVGPRRNMMNEMLNKNLIYVLPWCDWRASGTMAHTRDHECGFSQRWKHRRWSHKHSFDQDECRRMMKCAVQLDPPPQAILPFAHRFNLINESFPSKCCCRYELIHLFLGRFDSHSLWIVRRMLRSSLASHHCYADYHFVACHFGCFYE